MSVAKSLTAEDYPADNPHVWADVNSETVVKPVCNARELVAQSTEIATLDEVYAPTNVTLGSIETSSGTLTSEQYAQQFLNEGGGGDIHLKYGARFTLNWPLFVRDLIANDGVILDLGIGISWRADPSDRITRYFDDRTTPYSVNVDWSSLFDTYVILATNRYVNNSRIRFWVLTVWGKVKTQLPKLNTRVILMWGGIGNTHDDNYQRYRATVEVDTTIRSIRDTFSAPVNFDWEVVDADVL